MELKNYLIGKINILKKKNDILNNFIELKGNIDFLNKAISNYEFEKMNVDDLKNVLIRMQNFHIIKVVIYKI